MFCEVAALRAPNDLEAQKLLNDSLAASGVKIHGQNLQVKASRRYNKRAGVWFQLRCNPKTCTWSGRAQYDSARKALQGKEIVGRRHGVLKQRKKNSGRKEKTTQTPHVQQTVEYTGERTKKALRQWVHRFFREKPLRESICVACRSKKTTSTGAGLVFQCVTHLRCPWHGTAKLVPAHSAEPGNESSWLVRLRHSPCEAHRPTERTMYGTLTWKQRECIRRSKVVRTKQVDRELRKLRRGDRDEEQVTPPSQKMPGDYMARYRKSLREDDVRVSKRPNNSYFHDLVDHLNASIGGPTELQLGDRRLRLDDGQLRALHVRVDGDELSIPMVCPALIAAVLRMVPQPWYLKLSMDGTYRLLVFRNYVLLNVGCNVKTFSPAGAQKLDGYSSTYVPLGFALAHVESGPSYTKLLEAVLHVAGMVRGEDGRPFAPDSIGQVHGDLHKGLENARRRILPNSIRLHDWAHCCGATNKGPAGFPGPAEHAWRKTVMRLFHSSRFAPKYVFHLAWSSLFGELSEDVRGRSLLSATQHEYFHQQDDLWSAYWRAGPDRVAPGTATGSAAQEAWHGHTLKELIPKHNSPRGLATALNEQIVQPLLQDLRKRAASADHFQEWPAVGQRLDLCVLNSEGEMRAQGRTCATSLLAWGLHHSHQDESGNAHYLIPASRLRNATVDETDYPQDRRRPVYVDRPVRPVPPEATACMARAALARTVADAESALAQLGVYSPEMHTITNWPQLLRYLCDWRHVVIGPFVRQLWQSHGIADAPHNKHFNALCFFCEHAAKSGPCEHAYAAMVCAGLISTTPPPVPKQSGRPRKKPRAAGATAALVPAPSLPREAAPNVKPAADAQASAPDPLEALLRSAGLSAYLPTVRQTGATLHMLRSMDSLTDFRTFFGMSLGDAFALRAALQNWKDATEATQNDDACAAPSSAAAQKPRPKEQSSRQRDPDFFIALRQVYGNKP